MENIFISKIMVNKVRHLKDLEIPLAKDKKKHLIITGKNGSGKTVLLDAIATYIYRQIGAGDVRELDVRVPVEERENIGQSDDWIIVQQSINQNRNNRIRAYIEYFRMVEWGIDMETNFPLNSINSLFEQGKFIVAHYKAERSLAAWRPKHIEKVALKENYKISETSQEEFLKYLVDMKMTEALAVASGKTEKVEKIREWFEKLQELLRRIFECNSLHLEFDEDTFKFNICMEGREKFDFNTLSSGYAAILDIVVGLIMRMEKQTNKTFDFHLPGIVLIDEIETHLHIEMQKNILELLTTVFPNIQFIVSTHSPFILNSLENTVIYDLENHVLVENGLADVPYAGIVEGYFRADTMSKILREKYERYKTLVQKKSLSDSEFEEIARLELFLDEIPDYLALDITTEYKRMKMEFEQREDL